MNIYEQLAKKLNARLAEYETPVRAEVRSLTHKGVVYPFVAFENPQNHMGIAINYDEGEWTIEFLGTHGRELDMEDFDEYLFGAYILPILADVLVVAIMPDGGQVTVDTRRLDGEGFSDAALSEAADVKILSWSGNLPEETLMRCRAYARRLYK